MLIQRESDGKAKAWAEKVLLLFWCSLKRASKSRELSFMQYGECVLFSDKVHKAVSSLCPQSGTAGFVEDEHVAEKEKADGDAIAADERFGVILFQSAVCTVHNDWTIIAPHSLQREATWVYSSVLNYQLFPGFCSEVGHITLLEESLLGASVSKKPRRSS